MHLSTIVNTRCPSSVVNFSHFWLLLWNRWTEFKETWQEARSQCLLPSLCFLGRSEKQDGRPGLWLSETFSTSPLKPLNGIHRNMTRSKISTSSTKFVFFGPIGKTSWPPWPLIGWDIFDFSSETAERNSTKLDRKQDLNILYQVSVFQADRKKQDGHPGWDIFDLSSETAKQNSTKLDRKQDLNVLYQVSFFSGRSEKQDGHPGLWLAETFSGTAEQNSTKLDRNSTKLDRKQDLNILYQVSVFQADRKNKMATLAETFSTYPLKPPNRIQQNLIGSKISMSSTK